MAKKKNPGVTCSCEEMVRNHAREGEVEGNPRQDDPTFIAACKYADEMHFYINYDPSSSFCRAENPIPRISGGDAHGATSVRENDSGSHGFSEACLLHPGRVGCAAGGER